MTTSATLELHIDGMDCAGCALHVQEQISGVAGVTRANVLLAAEKGIIIYDPAVTDQEEVEEEIKEAVAAIGYRAQAVDDAPLETGSSERIFSIVRLVLVGVVGFLALAELIGGWLGWLDGVGSLVPDWVALIAVFVGGYPIYKRAFLGLRARTLNADLLMSIGIFAAVAIGEFTSAVLLVFFLLIAHFLESYTTDKARAAIRELVALTPKQARVVRDGQEVELPAEALIPGDTVIVRPGELIPADGRVVVGRSAVNQAPITGESMPVEKGPGQEVFAATHNELGSLRIEVTRVGADTTLGQIIRLVEEAEGAKAPVQRFADRFTTYFLPVVLAIAILTYLISGNIVSTIAVLVVACPCAVALATPLAVVASVGGAARRGLLIKGGIYLEALAKVDTVLMDKTGTLTFGEPKLTDIALVDGALADGAPVTETDLLRMAAGLERDSEHALAKAILTEAEQQEIAPPALAHFEALPGYGVTGDLDGQRLNLGNRMLMKRCGAMISASLEAQAQELECQGKTAIFLARDGDLLGMIGVADIIRDEVPDAIEALRKLGIDRLMLLTGDNQRTAAATARQLGIDYRAELLPEDKIAYVKELQAQGRRVAMIGDGINDAPALTQADVGIAMGVAGTDVALEAADVALMRDDWSEVPEALRLGRRAFRTIKQNIGFGILFNVVGISLAAVGILTPIMAAAAESLPDVAVFVNSSRLLRR